MLCPSRLRYSYLLWVLQTRHSSCILLPNISVLLVRGCFAGYPFLSSSFSCLPLLFPFLVPLAANTNPQFYDIAGQPWFHGDIDKHKAEAYLLKSKRSRKGGWLVRYSARPGKSPTTLHSLCCCCSWVYSYFKGDFRVSVLNVPTFGRAEFKHYIVVNEQGYFVWVKVPKGLNQSIEFDRQTVLTVPPLSSFLFLLSSPQLVLSSTTTSNGLRAFLLYWNVMHPAWAWSMYYLVPCLASCCNI